MSINTIVTAEGKFSYDQFRFSSATESNGFLFCSGVIGSDNRGKIPAHISEEFHNAWKAVGCLFKQVNADYSNIM
jgi:enamine deaminase RidA (YjgF/YER057c/UK114 family)